MGSNEKVLKENKPTADVLMSSMRSMGYTFEAAIADIIDNSVSVHATQIEIKFPVDPAEIYVAVCDNGTGMSKEELFDAMKYGSSLKRGKGVKMTSVDLDLVLKRRLYLNAENLLLSVKKMIICLPISGILMW